MENRREFLVNCAALAATVATGCAHLRETSDSSMKSDPPLADIHAHSDTSHTPESILRIANEFGVSPFKGKTVEEVRAVIQAPPGSNWDTWYAHMKQTRLAYVSPEAIGALVEDALNNAASSGVALIDLRISIISTVQALLDNLGIKDPKERWKYAALILDRIIEAVQRCSGKIKTDLLVSISSQKKYQDLVPDLVKFCLDYRRHIIGLDITNEKDLPPSSFRSHIERARADIKFLTIHCMEIMGPERGWDALSLDPDRIGHGIRAAEDPKLVQEIAQRGIPLEICVRSNLVTGAVKNIRDHQMRRLFESGVTLTIGSDGCNDSSTLADNYALIQQEIGFSDAQMAEFKKNTWQQAFSNRAS